VAAVVHRGHCEVMTDLPITTADERPWTDDDDPAAELATSIDERVLRDASEADAIDQRLEVPVDDPDDR
jgi:hypothetical protein